MVFLLYTTYISEDLAHHELFYVKVGKGGISILKYHWVVRLYVEIIHEH